MRKTIISGLMLVLLPLLGAKQFQVGQRSFTVPISSLTYGYTPIGASNTGQSATAIICNAVTATTGTDSLGYTITAGYMYGFSSASATIQFGVFTPSGTSATLVAHSGSSTALTGTPAWTTVAFSGTLAASTTYNVCMMNSAAYNFYYDTSVSGFSFLYDTGSPTYGTWPGTYTWGANAGDALSLYITVTPN